MKVHLIPILVLTACAGTPRIIDDPAPITEKREVPGKERSIFFSIPLSETWEDVPAAPSRARTWKHRETGGVIVMTVCLPRDGDVSAILDAKLGELRRSEHEAVNIRFFAEGALIEWFAKDGARSGALAARGFPGPDGPVMLLFEGAWPAKHHRKMTEDFKSLVLEITASEG